MNNNLFNSLNILDLSVWYDLPLSLQYIVVLIFGLCAGSFINVVIYRLPLIFENELKEYIEEQTKQEGGPCIPQEFGIKDKKQNISLSKPSSACGNCGYMLRWYDNIPILSWIFLKAKCRICHSKISIQYPVVELISGIGTLFCYIAFNYIGQSFFAILLFWLLLTITILDAKTQLLPNELSQPLIFLGLFCGWQNIFIDANTAIAGFLFGFFILWIVAFLFKLIRGYEGLGSGDPYLLSGIGAFIGIDYTLYTIFFASILGIFFVICRKIFMSKDIYGAIAFGPFISISGFLVFLYVNHVI